MEKETKHRFHDLRRTTARNLNRAGVPDRIAMSLMGHKTRAMYDRYNIVDEEDMREASAQMQQWLQDRPNPGTVTKKGLERTFSNPLIFLYPLQDLNL